MTTLPQSYTPLLVVHQLVYVVTNVYSQFSIKLIVDWLKYNLLRTIFHVIGQGAKVVDHITDKSQPFGDDDED